MGMMDNIKKAFGSLRGSNNNVQSVEKEDPHEKSMVITQIINSVDRIKRINSFDSSIWNLSNASENSLQRKSLAELKNIQFSLNSRLIELDRQSERTNSQRESLEQSKWTGEKPKGMSDHDFDVLQNDGEYR